MSKVSIAVRLATRNAAIKKAFGEFARPVPRNALPPMVMQPPLNLNIIASVACPEDSAYLISFLGRKPECEKHDALAGQPHEPCWSMAKATFSPTEQPGDRGTCE